MHNIKIMSSNYEIIQFENNLAPPVFARHPNISNCSFIPALHKSALSFPSFWTFSTYSHRMMTGLG